MTEIWKDVVGYEGLYLVSSLGNIKSAKTGKILKPSHNAKKYKQVVLYRWPKCTTYKVHRLVAGAFVDNPKNLPQVNHLDKNVENNTASNLEWCSNQDNIIHAFSRKYKLINDTKGLEIVTNNLKGTCEELGIPSSNMFHVLHGKRNSCHGWTVRYV